MNSSLPDNKLFHQLKELMTEQRNEQTKDIDIAEAIEIVRLINDEDSNISDRIKLKLPLIAEAVDLVFEGLNKGGRLIYFGAGTSGRLGVLDAVECPPTFGTNPEQVQGYIAGGKEAMFIAQEGAEDFERNGEKDVVKAEIRPPDVVCGLAASGRTPYVHGALKEAARRGCKTLMITTVPASQVTLETDIMIDIPVGPEVIMGSTRMKSATAQKMVLNMISTGAMIRLGKVYENVMVDLKLSNKKLEERAKRIIMYFTDTDYDASSELLMKSNGHVKTAILMGLTGLSESESEELLNKNDGFLRKALSDSEGMGRTTP